jgi:hypothetical protein
MAQSSRQRRKARKRAQAAVPPPEQQAGETRSEAKNREAREALEPLEPGERPVAVTVAAILTSVLALLNLGGFIVGIEIQGQPVSVTAFLLYEAVAIVMSYGLWRARYWAVLGLQTLLGITVVLGLISSLGVSDWIDALIVAAMVIPSGALFFFLVKAMARIQMPERR